MVVYLKDYSPYLDSSLLIVNLRIQLELICWATTPPVVIMLLTFLFTYITQPNNKSTVVLLQGSVTFIGFLISGVYVIYKLQSRFNIAKELVGIVNKSIVSFIGLKGLRVQQGAADYLYDVRVCLYKEVCKNFAGVLGFSHFGIINIAYLGGLWRQEKTKNRFGTVLVYRRVGAYRL